MDCVLTLDPHGAIRHADAAAAALLGRELAALMGRSLAEVGLGTAPAGRLAESLQAALQRGRACAELAVELATPHGPLPLSCVLLPAFDDGGALQSVGVWLRERGDADALAILRRSERHLRAIFSGTHEFFGVMDAEGTLLEANRASIAFAPELLGDVIGRKFWDTAWFHSTPGMPEMVRQAIAAAAAGHLVSQEMTLIHPSGTRTDFDFSLYPVTDETGRVVLIVPEGRNITERKRAEARQRELEAQLLQVQKMESIGALAGGIAHDFNNILAAILGNLALAMQDVGPGHAAVPRLEQIASSGARARGLVQQILAFSRHQPQELTVQPLRPLVAETLAMLRATLPAGVRLQARLHDAPLYLRANATQIQQALMNIGTNAWHALPPEGGTIEIGLEPVDVADGEGRASVMRMAAGRHAHVWVRDSGAGMDEATRQRIFEPFFTTKPVGRGTGLGLSVVHGIVAGLGGGIAVDSAPGAGTTLHLYLPLAPDELAAAATVAARPARAQHPGRGERIVYIDDDEVVALMAEGLLRRAGYQVTVYCDADAALAAIEAATDGPDLVVTDYNMPRRSGLDVARRLTARRPGLPVVMTSGYISDELRGQALQAGVRELLNKENSAEELCALVGRTLAQPNDSQGAR